MKILALLDSAKKIGASDIHIVAEKPPFIRLNGVLTPLNSSVITNEDILEMTKQLLDDEQYKRFNEYGQIDISYQIPDEGVFRTNIYRYSGLIGIACRIISDAIPTIQSLRLPEIVKTLSRRSSGLILVTGPTGSGKSTTIAAMIDLINEEKQCHILTIEDPIEYVHKHNKSVITQREIRRDCPSFSEALRSGLRQDPDVIMVGEMRDLETISTAVTAAETGHLVLASLHTRNAVQTIERIIDVFPANQQQQIRVQLANSLTGIISQLLLPRKDNNGRVVLVESLIVTPAVRNIVRESKMHQLYSLMQTGKKSGMQTMDNHLKLLYEDNIISEDILLEYALDQENMQKIINASR
ncbi:MAG: type IV pilus twitching motility protein PilT [Thermotaleaceae bacterium]